MITAFLRTWGIIVVALKRVFAQRGLALATSLGIISAVAMTMSIPIYSDAVYQNIYQTEVSRKEADKNVLMGSRPPYAFMFRYVGAWSNPVPKEQLAPIDAYMSGPVEQALGLPKQLFVRYLKSDSFQLFPTNTTNYDDPKNTLEYVYFGTVSDLESHMDLLEGSMPEVASTAPDSPVPVLMAQPMADKLGVQIGDTFIAYALYKSEQGKVRIQFPVLITGIWKARDPAENYWFYDWSEFNTVFIVPEETFSNRILPYLKNEVDLALWYWVMDGSHVHSADVPAIMGKIAEVERTMTQLLPKTRLDVSPKEMLIRFQSSSSSLATFLYIFSIPLMVMILTFILLVVDMMVGNRRNEIAVLRSRGATISQILGMSVLESFMLGVVGVAVGAPFSLVVAQFFGKTQSFLNFTAKTNLQPDINMAALQLGLIAAAVTLVAQVFPTIGAARHSIISYKQERARQLRPPLWQRIGLDLMLFIPAAYGAYMLRKQGSLFIPKIGTVVSAASGDPFQNPLLVLVPSLIIFSATMFLLRILPLLMSSIAWIASKTKSVGILMASRYLSRTSSGFNAPLILLILTLSLSTFTATLAQTLDRHLRDQTYYKIGADMNLVEMGEFTGPASSPFAPAAAQPAATSETDPPRWVFLPVAEHLKIPGVAAATRVFHNDLRITSGANGAQSVYIGIDRIDFPKAAFWRRDFASESLGALMNKLALSPEAVLVSEQLMLDYNLKPGDLIEASTYSLESVTQLAFQVMGTVKYFPTWYPTDGYLIVGNADNFFEQAGGELPYDVWVKAKTGANYDSIIAGVGDMYNNVLYSEISPRMIATEQQRPERQGFFGLLSVGFTALAFLTVLGFLLYALFSFRRRFIELGMLRAIGLSAWQMFVLLASELAFLFMVGLGAGTGLGVGVSNFFIPYLQIGTTPAARIPPYVVHIDWLSVFQIYILFGLLFVVALAVLTFLLMRMKIFQAVKMGEAG
jgi:putative ABC transport system permease protein